MRHTLLVLVAVFATTAPAAAQSRFDAPQPRSAPESAPTSKTVLAPAHAVAPVDASHAEAQAQMDRFEQRLATRSDRAIRSICSGCGTTGARPRPAIRRAEANAQAPELAVEDPAQAPID